MALRIDMYTVGLWCCVPSELVISGFRLGKANGNAPQLGNSKSDKVPRVERWRHFIKATHAVNSKWSSNSQVVNSPCQAAGCQFCLFNSFQKSNILFAFVYRLFQQCVESKLHSWLSGTFWFGARISSIPIKGPLVLFKPWETYLKATRVTFGCSWGAPGSASRKSR